MLPLLFPLIGGLVGGGLNTIGYVIQQKLRGEPINGWVALSSFGSGFVAGALCAMPFGEAVIAAGGVGAWTYLAGIMALASIPPRIVENRLAKRRWTDGLLWLAVLAALSAPIMSGVLMPIAAKVPGLQAAAQKAAADAIDKAGNILGGSALESLAPVTEAAATKTAAEIWSEATGRAVETWGGSLPMVSSVGREVLVKGTGSVGSLLDETTPGASRPSTTPGMLSTIGHLSDTPSSETPAPAASEKP